MDSKRLIVFDLLPYSKTGSATILENLSCGSFFWSVSGFKISRRLLSVNV